MQNISQFQRLCHVLQSLPYRSYQEKPLAYWILPTDRRLPLAFLSRGLGEIVRTSFEDLAKTPGIGKKKMAALMKLLARAAETEPADFGSIDAMPIAAAERCAGAASSAAANSADGTSFDRRVPNDGFDPASVSEIQWSRWRSNVLRFRLDGEKLGRFAPSLKRVTRVIWNTPLAVFAGYTLAEMRGMKTFGEKRIHAILQVFHGIHGLLSGVGTQPHLTVRIVPPSIDQVEQWVGRALQAPGIPDEDEIFAHFVRPLVRQIEIDALPQIVTLVEHRLGINGPACSVRQTARNMGLTRARVYQLLNDVNDIAAVRWPLGRHQVYELRQKFAREAAELDSPPNLTQFHAAVEIIFPGSRRGADGSLEYLAADFEEDELDFVEA